MIDTVVATVADSSARAIAPDTLLPEAAEQLRSTDVSALVVHDGESVVGMVTESDVVATVAETNGRPPVGAIMSRPVATTEPDATLREAAERMRTAGVRHLPVVDDGVYYGLVSAETLAPYLSRHKVDVEWKGDPVRVDATGETEATAGD